MAFSLRNWFEEAVAQVVPGDKRTAQTVRQQRQQAPVAQTIRRQPANNIVNNRFTRGIANTASRAWDTVNQYDGGRTWSQRTPTNNQSVIQQGLNNKATQLIKKSVIQPAVDTTQRIANTTGALGANITGLHGAAVSRLAGNKELSDSFLRSGSKMSDRFLNSGWGGKGGVINAAQAQTRGQGLTGVRDTVVKPALREASVISQFAVPGVGGAASLPLRVASQAGANAGAAAVTDAASQYANTGRVNPVQTAKAAATGGVIGGAIPVAGAVVKAAKPKPVFAHYEPKLQESLADIQNRGSRPPVQQQLELAHNTGDVQSVRKIIDSMPDDDPYKPAMRSVFKSDLEQADLPANAEQRIFGQNPMLPENQPPLIGRDAGQVQPKLPEFNTKKVGNLDKMWRSTRSIIERQGPSGQQLAGMLRGARDTGELFQAEITRQIPTVLKLKGKRYENFVEATQGKEAPRDAMVAQAVQEWRATHPQIRDRAIKAGLDVGDLGETYYPHFIDYDKIFKDKNTFNAAINHLVQTGQARTPDEAIRVLNYARDVSRDRKFGNLESERLLDLPMYDKTRDSLVSYLQGSSRRIAQTETFGANDEKALELIKKAALEGADTEAMKNAYDIAVGARKYNPGTTKASRVIRQYNTTTKLGLGALTNTSQSVNTGVVTGHFRTMGAMLKQLNPEQRDFVQKTGVIADAVINDIREMGGGFVGKVIGKITAPGFGAVEKFNRGVAAVAGRDYANSLARRGKVDALRKLGVTGDIGRELTEAQQIQAARRIVEKTQFKVDPQDLPGWVDSPWGKVVAQFRTFSYNQGKFFSNEVLKPLFKQGNALPLARVIAALPVGYAIVSTRGELTNRTPEENPARRGLEAFSAIGGAGLAPDAVRLFFPMNGKYTPTDRRISMATSFLGGPTAGTASDVIGGLSEIVQRKNVPDEGLATNKLGLFPGMNKEGDEQYTDATSLARTGLRQIPIVGGRLQNSFLPYKEREDATSNADNFKRGLGDFFGTLAKPFTNEASADTGQEPINTKEALKQAKKATKDEKKSFESKFSKDDLELYKLNKNERQSLVDDGVVPQEKFDQLDRYAEGVKKNMGKNVGAKDVTIKDDERGSELVNALGDMSKEDREKWTSQELDSNYRDLYDRASKIRYDGLPDLPKNNKVLSLYAELLEKRSKGMSNVADNRAKLDFLKSAYQTSYSKDAQELRNLPDGDIVSALETGLVDQAVLDEAVALDNLLVKSKLQKSPSIGNSLRRQLGYDTISSGSGKKKSGGRKRGGGSSEYRLFGLANPIEHDRTLRQLVRRAAL